MGTRQSQQRQDEIWIANAESARSPGHSFCQRLNELLDSEKFDPFVEGLCPTDNPHDPEMAGAEFWRTTNARRRAAQTPHNVSNRPDSTEGYFGTCQYAQRFGVPLGIITRRCPHTIDTPLKCRFRNRWAPSSRARQAGSHPSPCAAFHPAWSDRR